MTPNQQLAVFIGSLFIGPILMYVLARLYVTYKEWRIRKRGFNPEWYKD